MQYGYEDFSSKEVGCCLNCIDSCEECLCFNCKCTKCFYYLPPEEYDGKKGHCDKTNELKEEKRNKWCDNFANEQRKKRLEESKGQTTIGDYK